MVRLQLYYLATAHWLLAVLSSLVLARLGCCTVQVRVPRGRLARGACHRVSGCHHVVSRYVTRLSCGRRCHGWSPVHCPVLTNSLCLPLVRIIEMKYKLNANIAATPGYTIRPRCHCYKHQLQQLVLDNWSTPVP